MRRVSSVTALFLLAACVETGPPTVPPTPPPSPPIATAPARPDPPATRDDGRLPATVKPKRYALELRIDPSQPRFSGVTTIQVDVAQPTWYVVLHARDMNVARAFARIGTREIPAVTSSRVAHGGAQAEELLLTFAQPLPPGEAQLVLAYDGPFASDLQGLYRVQDGGAWYAYTQFEATDARRAFPCFDEPGFKTAYDVTITAPRGQTVLSNAPESAQKDTPDGMVEHRFQTSRPMPSYLVAFAVGDFDVVQGQSSPFPIRAVTTKGKGGLTTLALEAAVALIERLGDYFDVRYPYEKLDIVAVPDFAAGAMENPGLVTFRDVLLLLDPRHATTTMKREQALTIAHEFAHQWFGDLVTMTWWDDVWLNEGFATWAEAKMVDEWRPSFGALVEQVSSVQAVMDTDALTTTRAVRQPTHSTADVMEAFDGITYEKGAAVLRMLERWLGPDTFRRGVQLYLHDHAWGNARADDLFKALDFVSTQKVGDLAGGFLNQTGVPSVQVSWKCGGKDGSKLELRESEWRPLGETEHPARKWMLPVCVAAPGQKSACFTLGAEPIVRDLGPACPPWVYPNADEAGYYRFLLDRTQLLALARGSGSLSPADRLGLVSNAWAGVRQGALDPGALLDVLPMFDADTNHYVVAQVSGALRGVDDALVEDADRPAFRRYAAARLAGKKAALGWEAAPGAAKEGDERILERSVVLRAMGEAAYDKATLDEAEKYARRWLKDPDSVPADTAAVALPLASMRSGLARLDELRAAAKAPLSPEDHVIAIRAMGTFDDPATLRKALDVAFDGELRPSELTYLVSAAMDHRASAPVLYAWLKEHWDKAKTVVPSAERWMLVSPAGRLCTVADRDAAKAFLGPATQSLEGTKRWLDESLEEAGLCAALREHGTADVERYFRHK